MDFDTAIAQAQQAVHYFLNNDFENAKQILEPWSENSMYHSLGTSLFAFLEATLTFEQVILCFLELHYKHSFMHINNFLDFKMMFKEILNLYNTYIKKATYFVAFEIKKFNFIK
jgi:hypothetical protein